MKCPHCKNDDNLLLSKIGKHYTRISGRFESDGELYHCEVCSKDFTQLMEKVNYEETMEAKV